MTRSPAAAAPRLSGPGELVAALPLLCGFVPRESLVVVCLEGEHRIGLTLRLDLPAPADEELVAAELVARVRHSGASRAYLVVLTEQPGQPHRALLDGLRAEVDAVDVLLVRSGRWWSYLCREPACCPEEGTPVPASSPTLGRVRAESVLQGRAVLPSREDLVASLAPPAVPQVRALALVRAAERLADERRDSGQAAVRTRLLRAFRAALTAGPDPETAAELALALGDVLVRDDVLTWALREEDAVLALLVGLARLTPAPFDAPVCAGLAWVAYGRGDGATASVALDRALATDPEHGLARLLRQALDAQVRPRDLRAVSARAAGVLQGRRRR